MTASRFAVPLLVLTLGISPSLPAQQPAARPGDAMIENYLAQETAKLSQRFLDGAKTYADWEIKRSRLRQEYLDMLGLWPIPEKTPLNVKITGTIQRDGDAFVIDKLHFQSRPGLYVTGNLYRPKASGGSNPPGGKLPAVLYVCGHSGRGRDGNKSAFQDHGMWFASNGYVCLVIDTLQLGEIPGVHHGTYGRPFPHLKAYGIADKDKLDNRWWWYSAGYTPAGVECWNGIRAIDYLVSRPDVDPNRITVTGISGGGAATIWISAADERVKCAVPVSGMSDLESYVTNKVINGHCDCMFLHNTYQWEWTTIAALIAPRPMLFANSDMDKIFPMDGNRRIIERLRQVYKLYGKPELVDEYVSKGGHDYRPDLRIAIFQFINKHGKAASRERERPEEVKDSAEFKPLAGKELRAFPEDSDIPKDAINIKIDESFVKLAEVKLPEKGKFEQWKKELMKELRARSFREWPERIPPATAAKDRLTTEAGIEVLFAGFRFAEGKGKTLIVVDTGEDPIEVMKAAEQFLKNENVAYALRWRGSAGLSWTIKSPPNYIERSHVLLGRTVDQGRVWDIAATARYCQMEKNDQAKWRVIGRGQAGILAAYAALFEPSISEVVIIDPPVSHKDGPTFLNVLRVLDIPDALGMLAPRPLTLINAKDRAFDRTAEIYRIAGAEAKLQRK